MLLLADLQVINMAFDVHEDGSVRGTDYMT